MMNNRNRETDIEVEQWLHDP